MVLLMNGVEKLDELDYLRNTPLNLAIKSGSFMIAKMLIEMGADVESRDKNSRTPLMNAC